MSLNWKSVTAEHIRSAIRTGRERQAVVPLDDPGILRCPTIGNCR